MSSRRRNQLHVLGAALGVLVLAGGEYTLANTNVVIGLLSRVYGSTAQPLLFLMSWLLPPGIALGLGLLLLGALLVALAVGLPAATEDPTAAAVHDAPPHPTRRSSKYALTALGGALTALSCALLLQAGPGRWAVASWVAMLLTGLALAVVFDRQRGTRCGNPFPYRWEWSSVLLLVAVDLVYVAHDLSHWRWSGTPDEAHFFETAKAIAQASFNRFPLSEEGVFGQPLLSSYYQAFLMKLFGMNIFAWRLSSALALAVSLPPLYLLTREIWNRRAAYVAAIFFGSAQLAVGFSHYGYNNVQNYPFLVGALALFAWAARCRSVCAYYLAGCVAGLGFYTYHTARLAPILMALLAASLGAAWWRRDGRVATIAVLAGIMLTALPLLLHPGDMLVRMFRLTNFAAGPHAGGPELSRYLTAMFATEGTAARILRHWLISILYPPWFPCPSHFQENPVVDRIAGVLAVIGFGLALGALLTRRRSGFLVPGYLMMALIAGALSPHACPPLTRLQSLAPLTALFGALALDRLMRAVAAITKNQVTAWILGIGLVVGSVVWNVWALHDNIYHRNHGYGDGTTSELVRILLRLPADHQIVYIQRDDNSMYEVDAILNEYGMSGRLTYIRPFSPRAKTALDRITPPFIVAYDLGDAEQRRVVEETLAARFPGHRWADSAPGKPWNLRYFSLSADKS